MWPKTGTGISIRRHFDEKTIIGFFWGFLLPVSMDLVGRYLGQKVLSQSQTFGENFMLLA